MIRILTVEPRELGPYVPSLRRLEESITYPLDGDAFRIDHGPEYHSFFSEMGATRFVLAVEGTEVLGTLALVLKRGALYFADLKLRAEHRGTGLAGRIALHAARRAFERPSRFAWFAAMRGAKGDVTRSGGLLMKLLRPAARLHVYFAGADELALVPEGLRPPERGGLSLSAATPSLIVSTAGRKDLRLVSTGASWPLVHLAAPPAAWGSSLGTYLRRCAKVMPADAVACFALDERLADHVKWLEAAGVRPGASCTLYGSPRFPRAEWVHLATSEI